MYSSITSDHSITGSLQKCLLNIIFQLTANVYNSKLEIYKKHTILVADARNLRIRISVTVGNLCAVMVCGRSRQLKWVLAFWRRHNWKKNVKI